MRLVLCRILHAGYGLSLIALIATCAAAQTITLRRAVELTLSHSGVTGMADPDQARHSLIDNEPDSGTIEPPFLSEDKAYAGPLAYGRRA